MLTPRSTLTRRVLAALDAAPPRIPVLVGGCGAGKTTLVQIFRDRVGRGATQYIDVERTATTPERFFRAVAAASPFPISDQVAPGARAAFDAALAFLSRVKTGAAAREHGGPEAGDPISALASVIAVDGRLAKPCGFCYELRLHRARGYGALKAILEILADEEGLTLTEISVRLQRTPGSTKDYLSWLEDVDLVTSRQKRYSFSDPLLRVWVRLHCRASAPTDDDLSREVHRYALPRLPQQEPAQAAQPQPEAAYAMATVGPTSPSGLIEI